jgi:hypothetical protein
VFAALVFGERGRQRRGVLEIQLEGGVAQDQRTAAVPSEAREVDCGLIARPHPHVWRKAELRVLMRNEPTEKSRWAKVFDEVGEIRVEAFIDVGVVRFHIEATGSYGMQHRQLARGAVLVDLEHGYAIAQLVHRPTQGVERAAAPARHQQPVRVPRHEARKAGLRYPETREQIARGSTRAEDELLPQLLPEVRTLGLVRHTNRKIEAQNQVFPII